MAKPEWGTKRTCQNCGARFYDLKRDPIACPICQAVHAGERAAKPRRTPAPAANAAAAPAPAEKFEGADDAPVATKEMVEMVEMEEIADAADTGDPDAAEVAEIDGDSDDPMEDDFKLDDDDIKDFDESLDEKETV